MTAGVIVTVLAVMGVLYSLWWLVDRAIDRRVPQPARPDRRLPVSDYRLLGLDWRDHVTPYLHATGTLRLRLHELRRQLAAEKNETRDGDTSGFQDQ